MSERSGATSGGRACAGGCMRGRQWGRRAGRLSRVGVGLLIAGILGNLTDRLRYQHVVDFLLVAAAIFLVVKLINTAKARFDEKKDEAPAAPPEDVMLLREIRDVLVKR